MKSFGDYLKIVEEAQKKSEPFRLQLVELNEEFYEYPLRKYTERTARKHSTITDLFIEFICRQTDVENIDEITRGMVNTHFKKWWKRKVWDSTTPNPLKLNLPEASAIIWLPFRC